MRHVGRIRFGLALLVAASVVAPVAAHAHGGFAGIGGLFSGEPEDDEDEPEPCDDSLTCPCPPDEDAERGDPVDTRRGAWIFSHEDLVVPGVFPIRMERRYDSDSSYDSPLGYGWAFGYDMRVYEYPDDSVIVRTRCGTRSKYVFTGGAYVSPAGVRSKLVAGPAGSFDLIDAGGRKAHFDAQGSLTQLEDAQGNRLEFLYDARGKLPLIGTSPFGVDPTKPLVVATNFRLVQIRERTADGNLSGRFVNLAYDEMTGRLTSITSNDNRVVTYAHEPHAGTGLTTGNLAQVTGLGGITQAFLYQDPNDGHNVTSIQTGQATTPFVNTYDANGNVTRQTHGTDTLDFAYDQATGATTITHTVVDDQGANPQVAVTTNYVDGQRYLVRQVDPYKNEKRWTRDANHRVTREEIVENTGTIALPVLVTIRTTDYGYDAEGNRTSKTVTLDTSEVVTETWTYDHGWVASHETVSSLAPTKRFRTEYAFLRDAQSVPTNIQEIKRRRDDGSFETTTLAYDAAGRLSRITPPAVTPNDGLAIVRTYYGPAEASPGMLKKIHIETGGEEDPHLRREFSYDPGGFLATLTQVGGPVGSPRNDVTTYTWDVVGRLTEVENALGESTLYSYSGPNAGLGDPGTAPPGHHLASIEIGRTAAEGEGQLRRFRWDAAGRMVAVERKNDANQWSPFQTFAYDSTDRRLKSTDALGHTTRSAYDLLGRLTSITDAATPTGNVTTFAYDPLGQRTQVTNAKGHVTKFAYDDLGRLVTTTQEGSTSEPLAPPLVTAFGYDAAGNVLAITDPKSQTTDYTYDALSRLTAVEQPLGQTVFYAYDLRGRHSAMTNARANVLRYEYAAWGALLEVEHFANASAQTPVRTIFYTHDLAGNVATTGDTDLQPGPLYSFTYDPLGRVDTTTAKYIPGGDRVLDNAYDRFGNRKELVLYDVSETLTHAWTYDDLDRLTQATFPGSQTLGFQYFADDALEHVTHGNGTTTDYTYFPQGPVETITTKTSGGTQLHKLTYVLDPLLNVDALTEQYATGTSYQYDYGYDGANRLVSASYPTALGLPASESFTYDAAGNRELPGNPSAYDYDANNRVTASPGKTYGFDADGSVSSIAEGANQITITNDFVKRMRSYTNPATSTSATYAYDPFGRRVKKTVGSTETWFVWDGEVLLGEYDGSGGRTRRYTYADGWAPMQTATGSGGSHAIFDVHSDHLEAPKLLTGSSGSEAWRAAHAAFGDAAIQGGSTTSFGVRFAGQHVDYESGLIYNQQRSYHTETGRYLSADPVGQVAGLNLYIYALLNPISFSDPTGEFIPAALAAALATPAGQALALATAATIGHAVAYGNGWYGNPPLFPPPATPSLSTPQASTPVVCQQGQGEEPKAPTEEFDEFEDAVGSMDDLTNVETTTTTNPGLASQGYTEKWTGQASDGSWHSAFRNPKTGKFTGGHPSSRNWR